MYQQSRVLSRKEIQLGNQPSECSDEESFDLEVSHCTEFVVLSYIECSKSVMKSAKRVQTKIKSNVRSSS